MAPSSKEHLWLTCRDKRCCSYYTVFPTGRDVWRIATQLRIEPWTFTTPLPAAADDLDGLQLSADGERMRVSLSKQESGAASACVFLMRLAGGAARCGAGVLRPQPCHSFPSLLADGVLYLMNDGGCSCRTWSYADVDIDEEAARLLEEQQERNLYRSVLASWNRYVCSTEAREVGYRDFCRYLLDVYTTLHEQEA